MYKITRDFIRKGNARSGQPLVGGKPQFIVAHDIGNGGSTAYNNRTYFNNNQPNSSAHTFIDDQYILEIIPLNEKAWHVINYAPTDNRMFGDDANDTAIGVELCWGGKINFQEAYKRYVWYFSYLCTTFGLNPRTKIVAHSTLDPGRRTDPDKNSFAKNGITWKQFINDVEDAMANSHWEKADDKWSFYKNGTKQTGWVLDNNNWYLLDSNGVMLTGWQYTGEKWYLLGENGAMKTGWQKVDGKWYFLESSGAMKTGWLFHGGKWYYLNQKGEMQTGSLTLNGKRYFLQDTGALIITNQDGEILT